MMKILTLFLSGLMIFGLDAVGLDHDYTSLAFSGGPGNATLAEWSDNASGVSDMSKKRRKKRRKKSKGRRGSAGAFEQGVKVVSLGYGTPNLTKAIFSIYNMMENYENTGIGPLHVKFEYGLSDKIGLGVSSNFVQSKVRWTEMDFFGSGTNYSEGFDYMALDINIRANWHFYTTDKFDSYLGIGVGYNQIAWSYYTDYENATPLSLSVAAPIGYESTVGMRYFFTDNIGAFLELGYAKSLVQAGVSIKF